MSNTDAAQTELELERLREENERLRRALSDRQQLATTNPPSPQSLINDQSFIEDLSRFAEGVLTEKQVRQKWHLLAEADWERFGKDDAFVERIELERTRRIRSGATKRELAQNHIVKGPSILNEIMSDPKQSARHRVDSIKALDAIADPGSQASHDEMDRVIVTINLGGDE